MSSHARKKGEMGLWATEGRLPALSNIKCCSYALHAVLLETGSCVCRRNFTLPEPVMALASVPGNGPKPPLSASPKHLFPFRGHKLHMLP